MTKREALIGIRGLIEGREDAADYVEFLNGEVDKLDARAEKEREKREAKRAEGDELKDAIYAVIEAADEPITIDEILAQVEGATRAKVAFRAGVLVKEGAIEKCEVKIDKRKVVAYTVA